MSDTHNTETHTETFNLSDTDQIESWVRFFRSGKVQDPNKLCELENQLKQYLKEKRNRPLENINVIRLKELISSLETYSKAVKRLSVVRKETLDKKIKAKAKQKKINGYNSFGKNR